MRPARNRISTLLFLLFIASPLLAAPTILVSPSSIDSMTAGEVLVGATGLGGSEVQVVLWADVDDDGLVGAEDYVVWRDLVPDNAGGWSPVMAADEDPTPGTIAISARTFTLFNFPYTAGTYVWEVRDPADGSFDRAPFEVQQAVGGQSVSGYVDDGLGGPAAGAVVVLVPAQEECEALEYSAMADASGSWRIELPSDLDCARRLALAVRPGAVGSFFGGAVVELTGSGDQSGIDLELLDGTHAVQGDLYYDGSPRDGEGVPGVLLLAENDGGVSLAVTDFDGHYEFALEDGDWEIIPDSEMHLALQGAVFDDDVWAEVSVSGPTTASDMFLPAANAFAVGTLQDASLNPQAGRLVQAWEDWPCSGTCKSTSALTWPDGSFAVGLLAANARTQTGYTISPENPLAGLVARREHVTVVSGQTVNDVTLEHVAPSATISGRVTDLQGSPVGGLCFEADAWGPQAYSSRAKVACDGSYSLPVVDGDWNVRLEMDDLGGLLQGVDATPIYRQISVAGSSLEGYDLVLGGWLEAPTLVSLQPASGPTGIHIMLSGFGFPDPAATRVTFDGIDATLIDARPDLGRLVVEVPAGLAAGSVEVVVEDLDSGLVAQPSCFAHDGGTATAACTLGGSVTEFGGSTPLLGALVVVFDKDGERFLGAARTDAAGSWALSLGQAAPSHTLVYLPPTGFPHAWGVQPGVACGAAPAHDFNGGVPVSGMVTDEFGEPVSSVSVEAESDLGMSFTLTDSDGQFTLWLPAGVPTLIDYLAPWGSRYVNNQVVNVTPTGPITLPTMQYASGSLFVGRVVDEEGVGTRAYVDSYMRDGGALSGGSESATCSGIFPIAVAAGEHSLGIEPLALGDVDEGTEVRWIEVGADVQAEFDFAVHSAGALPANASRPRLVREIVQFGAVGQALLLEAENLSASGVEIFFSAAGGGSVAGVDTTWDVERGLVMTRVPASAASGELFLRVGAEDSRPTAFTVESDPYSAGPYTLSGTVTASGVPVDNVAVALFVPDAAEGGCDDDDDGLLHDYAVTNASGAYSLSHPGGDLMIVYFPPDATALAPRVTELLDESANRSGFDQSLVAGVAIHVRAVAGSPPAPVPNALVDVDSDGLFDLRLTDANGEATAWVLPGEYELYIEGPHGSRLLPQSTESTAPVDLGDVTLTPGLFLTARVEAHDGSALSGALAEAWSPTPPWNFFFEVTPDEDGLFHGAVEFGQPYQLWVEVPRDNVADLRESEDSGVARDTILYPTRVLDAAGLVEGILRDAATSSPLEWFFANVYTDAAGMFSESVGWAESCSDGSYGMKLPVGSYYAQGMADSPDSPWLPGWHSPGTAGSFCNLDAEPFEVAEGATTAGVDIELDQRAPISGSVRLYRDAASGSGISVTQGRLGSCEVGGELVGGGLYQVEVPVGDGYRVAASPPAGYPGSQQCWDSKRDCESWTPLSVPAGSGVGGIDFLFGDPPGEVSADWAPLRLFSDPGNMVTLVFEKRHDVDVVDGYNVYGGPLGNWFAPARTDCFIDPGSVPDNGDGTLSHSVSSSGQSEWFLVGASNVIGESPLGDERSPSPVCGAAP